MGPVSNNVSHISYAITATIGAAMAIFGLLDLGTIGSFLQYIRSFHQPLSCLLSTSKLNKKGVFALWKRRSSVKDVLVVYK